MTVSKNNVAQLHSLLKDRYRSLRQISVDCMQISSNEIHQYIMNLQRRPLLDYQKAIVGYAILYHKCSQSVESNPDILEFLLYDMHFGNKCRDDNLFLTIIMSINVSLLPLKYILSKSVTDIEIELKLYKRAEISLPNTRHIIIQYYKQYPTILQRLYQQIISISPSYFNYIRPMTEYDDDCFQFPSSSYSSSSYDNKTKEILKNDISKHMNGSQINGSKKDEIELYYSFLSSHTNNYYQYACIHHDMDKRSHSTIPLHKSPSSSQQPSTSSSSSSSSSSQTYEPSFPSSSSSSSHNHPSEAFYDILIALTQIDHQKDSEISSVEGDDNHHSQTLMNGYHSPISSNNSNSNSSDNGHINHNSDTDTTTTTTTNSATTLASTTLVIDVIEEENINLFQSALHTSLTPLMCQKVIQAIKNHPDILMKVQFEPSHLSSLVEYNPTIAAESLILLSQQSTSSTSHSSTTTTNTTTTNGHHHSSNGNITNSHSKSHDEDSLSTYTNGHHNNNQHTNEPHQIHINHNIDSLPPSTQSSIIQPYLNILLDMDINIQNVEVMNKIITVIDIPSEFLRKYIMSCMAGCTLMKDKYMQNRRVRIVCAFLQSLMRHKVGIILEEMSIEIQTFCIDFSRIKEASDLFRKLKNNNTVS